MSTTSAPAAAREPKRERGRLRVAAIIDAATALFAEKGYDAATMTEIAARGEHGDRLALSVLPDQIGTGRRAARRYGEQATAAFVELARRAPALPPPALADALVDILFHLQSNRAAVLVLAEATGDVDGRRAALRNAARRQIAAILLAASSAVLSPARAETMAILILHMAKPVPGLDREEPELADRLVAEARRLIRLYLTDALSPSRPSPGSPHRNSPA